MRLAFGAAVVVGHRGAQRLALVPAPRTGSRWSCRRRPPQRVPVSKSSAMRSRRRHRLVEVAVGVDAARRDDAAGGVDLARRRAAGRAPSCDDAAAARCRCRQSKVSLAVATRALRTTRSKAAVMGAPRAPATGTSAAAISADIVVDNRACTIAWCKILHRGLLRSLIARFGPVQMYWLEFMSTMIVEH